MASLKVKSIHAFTWSTVDRLATQILLLLHAVILSRLLDANDFGLVAMSAVFVALANVIVDSGMAGSLIRSPNFSSIDCNTLFWFSLLLSGLIYGILYFTAPMVAVFLAHNEFTLIIRVTGISIVLNSLSTIHRVRYVRDLNFRIIAITNICSYLVALSYSVFLAYSGKRIVALIVYPVVQAVVSNFFFWILLRWRPRFMFSRSSFVKMFSFGRGLLFSNILNIVFRNIYPLFIGKIFSPIYAGYYFQANRLYEAPFGTVSGIVDSVSYPVLSRVRDNIEVASNAFERLLKFLIFASIPIVGFFFAFSDDIVFLVLGPKWQTSAWMLKILSIGGLFFILEASSRSLLKVEGKTDLLFRLELAKKGIIAVTVFLCSYLGIEAFIFGVVINSFLSFLLNQLFIQTKIKHLNEIFQMFAVGVFCLLLCEWMKLFVENIYVEFCFGVLVFPFLYCLFCFLLKNKSFMWILVTIAEFLRGRTPLKRLDA